MKNTVKKILALVFAVAMICTLSVPAFAAEKTIPVSVTVVNYDGTSVNVDDVAVKASAATIESLLKAFNKEDGLNDKYKVTLLNGLVTKVGGDKADKVPNVFGTGYWAVALNGKLISEDLDTVAVDAYDRVVVYWNDPTFDTKLIQVDDSLLTKGVLSFYYYDAEDNRIALEDATVALSGITNKLEGTTLFTTDEEGQIWIAPEYLDRDAKSVIDITNVDIDELPLIFEKDGYTADECTFFEKYRGIRNIEDADVCAEDVYISESRFYTADATGDMTMVYVLVAAAAVITLAAVVVMKKKAVKAN